MIEWQVARLLSTCVNLQLACMQERSSLILAMLLNKLATNALPDEWRPEGRRKLYFKVQLTPDSPVLCTPEDLLKALLDKDGADLHMQIVSRITGFGLGAFLFCLPAFCIQLHQHHVCLIYHNYQNIIFCNGC
jgi:hypothetical protein